LERRNYRQFSHHFTKEFPACNSFATQAVEIFEGKCRQKNRVTRFPLCREHVTPIVTTSFFLQIAANTPKLILTR
jgi:hypothetical protein